MQDFAAFCTIAASESLSEPCNLLRCAFRVNFDRQEATAGTTHAPICVACLALLLVG
jgi:hypothetical protein